MAAALTYFAFTRGEVKLGAMALFGIGGCLIAASTLRDRWRTRAAQAADTVEVPGGIPLQKSPSEQRRMLATGLLFFAPVLFFGTVPGWVLAICLLFTVGSVAMLVASFLGYLPRPSLTFRPEGLFIAQGRGTDYFIDWDNFREVAAGTFSGNEAVFVNLVDLDRVRLGPNYPMKKFARAIAWNRGFSQCDIVLLAFLYGMTGGQLAGAIATYAGDREKRSRLQSPLTGSGLNGK